MKIILASKSGVRKKILYNNNIDCEVQISNVDEDGDIWLIELDSEGNSLDTSFVSIPGKQTGFSFIESEFNEFIIGGTTSSKNSGVTDAVERLANLVLRAASRSSKTKTLSSAMLVNALGLFLFCESGG